MTEWAERHAAAVDEPLLKLQALYNAPMLVAIAQDLRNQLERVRGLPQRLLFLARDTCLLVKLWRKLYPEIPCEYIYGNRKLFRHGTQSYFDYLNKKLATPAVMVDLAASCRSLLVAKPRIACHPPMLYAGFFLDQFGADTSGICLFYAAKAGEHGIDSTWVEMLNYDTQWRACHVTADGQASYDHIATYDMRAVQRMHSLFDQMLEDAPREPLEDPRRLATKLALDIQNHRGLLQDAFPEHMAREFEEIPTLNVPKETVHVVTSVTGYNWDKVKHWLWSLKSTGFAGRVHVLLYEDNPQLEAILKHHGVAVHRHEPIPGFQIVCYRWRDVASLCRDLPADDWVIPCDVSDVVFQRNPAEYLATVSERIVAPSESISFEHQWWAGPNMRDSFPEHWPFMRDKILYNAGSIAGRAGDIASLSASILRMCLEKPGARQHDQAAMNILLQTTFKDRTKFADASSGWCFCCASSICRPEDRELMIEPWCTWSEARCIAPGGTLAYLLHHYDRIPQLKAVVHRRVERDYEAWKIEKMACV